MKDDRNVDELLRTFLPTHVLPDPSKCEEVITFKSKMKGVTFSGYMEALNDPTISDEAVFGTLLALYDDENIHEESDTERNSSNLETYNLRPKVLIMLHAYLGAIFENPSNPATSRVALARKEGLEDTATYYDIARKMLEKRVVAEVVEMLILLLKERMARQVDGSADMENSCQYPQAQRNFALVLRRAIWGLLHTVADSIILKKEKELVLVTEDGEPRKEFFVMMRQRIGCDLDFPEFKIPFAVGLYREAGLHSIAGRNWRLAQGKGRSVYLEVVIGKDTITPQLFTEPWTKAKISKT